MTIEEMRKRKQILGYSYKTLAAKAGLPVGTVQKVLGGFSKAPREKTLQKLQDALMNDTSGFSSAKESLRETPAVYMTEKKIRYTSADYKQLPEEKQVELIDGNFYDMFSPGIAHQLIRIHLCTMLTNYITEIKGDCLTFGSPTDVFLDMDEHTVVQPDVFIVCDRSKISEQHIIGAPDFIAEITSPSTRKRDMTLKLNKYMNAGVREYWIIDPAKQIIFVYDFSDASSDADFVSIYHFEDQIPVKVFGGTCQIDFQIIADRISFLKQ